MRERLQSSLEAANTAVAAAAAIGSRTAVEPVPASLLPPTSAPPPPLPAAAGAPESAPALKPAASAAAPATEAEQGGSAPSLQLLQQALAADQDREREMLMSLSAPELRERALELRSLLITRELEIRVLKQQLQQPEWKRRGQVQA